MKSGIVLPLLSLAVVCTTFSASAQAIPTASRALDLSAFGGLSGVYTGLNSGKNLSITAGGDLGFRSVYSIYPALEVRGTYPVNRGHIDGQKNILAGIRVGKPYGRFYPYGDFLFGYGQISYDPLYPNPAGTFAYSYSSSTVLSPGGGLNFRITDTWSAKVDAQYQRYSTPVNTSGHLYSTPVTVGVVYHFFTNGGPR